jgi:hypothetical protein
MMNDELGIQNSILFGEEIEELLKVEGLQVLC